MMVRGFLATPVPSKIAYSPATIAQTLAEGLEENGHEITFYGPEGTDLKVSKVETLSIRPAVKTADQFDEFVGTTDLFEEYRPSLYDTHMAKKMLEAADRGELDCLLFHHFESILPLASLFPKVPVVCILHDFIDENRREMLELHASPNIHFISISDSQRRDAPDLAYSGTVYNGIDTEMFKPDGDPEEYLMVSGRITPSKGIKEAVQIAQQTGKRLYIAGSLSKTDSWYFDEHVKPHLNDRILFLGMLDRSQLVKYYCKASALLMPIQWQEPFGLAMAEAGSCGTPVIAFGRGSVPEVIANGKTGFIVDNSAEMILAIEKISQIKRSDCRKHVVDNFSIKKMIDGYDTVLRSIVLDKPTKSQQKKLLFKKGLRILSDHITK